MRNNICYDTYRLRNKTQRMYHLFSRRKLSTARVLRHASIVVRVIFRCCWFLNCLLVLVYLSVYVCPQVHGGGKRLHHEFRALYDYYGKRVDYGEGEFPSRWPTDVAQVRWRPKWNLRQLNSSVVWSDRKTPRRKYLVLAAAFLATSIVMIHRCNECTNTLLEKHLNKSCMNVLIFKSISYIHFGSALHRALYQNVTV